MHSVILFIAVIAYMVGGYFIVGKIGKFIDRNYKDYDYDITAEDEDKNKK